MSGCEVLEEPAQGRPREFSWPQPKAPGYIRRPAPPIVIRVSIRFGEEGARLATAKHESRMAIVSESDVVVAREKARALAAQIGFPPAERAMVTAAISELARNILDYAGRGELLVGPCEGEGRLGIMVVARDQGPGISDVDRVLQTGYAMSSLGLRGVQVLMDEVEVASVFGDGTTVTTRKWKP